MYRYCPSGSTGGHAVEFEALWHRRHTVALDDVQVALPSIDDLILTKQVASRPKDLEDIRLLRVLKEYRVDQT